MGLRVFLGKYCYMQFSYIWQSRKVHKDTFLWNRWCSVTNFGTGGQIMITVKMTKTWGRSPPTPPECFNCCWMLYRDIGQSKSVNGEVKNWSSHVNTSGYPKGDERLLWINLGFNSVNDCTVFKQPVSYYSSD